MEEQKTPRLIIVLSDDIIESRILTAAIYTILLSRIFRSEPWSAILDVICFGLAMALIVRYIYVIRDMSRLKTNKAEKDYSLVINTVNFIMCFLIGFYK